jgi:hypothetical protein
VLGAQLEGYAGRERLAEMVLGLISLGDRLAALARVPRVDGGSAGGGPLIEVLLGLLSVRRTLRQALGVVPGDGPDEPREPAPPPALPRGMMR